MSQLTPNARSYSECEIELIIQEGQYKELFEEYRIDPCHVFVDTGNSLLHLAIKHGSTNLTNTLIKLGCNINIQNKLGHTALMDAVLKESLLQVKLLLKEKSDIYATNNNGDSALKLSLQSVDNLTKVYIMKYFLEQVKSTATNSKKIAALLIEANCSLTCAIYLDDINVIKLMLENGCDINNSNFYNGWTALHVAIMSNNSEMVKLLIDCGCDVNITDIFGYLPLNYMLDYSIVQCPEIISALLPTDVNWTDLCYPEGTLKLRSIFVIGTKETLQLFLQLYKVNLRAKDQRGMTPLHYLAANNNVGIFDLFQNVDFDIDVGDKIFNKTALHVVATQGNVEGVKFFLANNANVNAVDYLGFTPLFYTVSRGTSRENEYQECIDLLINHGANLQIVTVNKDTIFKKASRCQNYGLIKPILARLAIIEAAGKPIKKLILDQIDSDIHLKRHYDLCKQELTILKKKTVYGTVTLLKFLIDNDTKVALYTRKPKSFSRIMATNFVSDSYYFQLLRKRFNEAKILDKLRTNAVLVLNESMKQLQQNHVIINQIIEFLSYKDLLKFS